MNLDFQRRRILAILKQAHSRRGAAKAQSDHQTEANLGEVWKPRVLMGGKDIRRDPFTDPIRNPIGWCDDTWNPWVGCTKVGVECQRCYALKEAHRKLTNPRTPWYAGTVSTNAAEVMKWTGVINQAGETMWQKPVRELRPSLFFTCSMSDFFHENALDEWRLRAFDIMRRTVGRHVFQILTKRPEEAEAFLDRNPGFIWPTNAWMGVSVGVRAAYRRIEILRWLPAPVKFLSVEPLLEPMPDLPLEGVDWVIVGGES